MLDWLKLYTLSVPIFFGIDMLWLGIIARNIYRSQLGHLMTPSINWAAAFLFYFVFLAGLVTFVIQPAVQKGSWLHALWTGAFFGLVTYATYDLTNLATLKSWPLTITCIDLVWGMVLSASVAVLTVFLARAL